MKLVVAVETLGFWELEILSSFLFVPRKEKNRRGVDHRRRYDANGEKTETEKIAQP